MKKHLPILLLALVPISLLAQSVSPAATNEFCPSTSLSFTFTAPGSYPSASVSSLGYANVSSQSNNGSGVVTATIQFADWNITQTIRLNYNDGSGGYADFPFTKIKSLYAADVLNEISPNISSISASQCASENFSISFSNISYVNPYTSPKLTYGTITSYQYSLPTGWSLSGGSTSSGPTDYKTGSNSVTVVSDDTNGDGGYVGIRAINSCSGSLIPGAWKYIPITRVKPSVTFSAVNPLCGSTTFSVSGAPSWVTGYQWAATASTMINFGSPTSSSTSISYGFDGQTPISLTLSKTGCSVVYNSADILGGAPKLVAGKPTLTTSLQLYSGPGTLNEVCLGVENYIPFYTNGLPYNTGYSFPTWSYVSHTGSPQPSWNGGDSSDIYVYFWRTQQTSLVLQIDATNNCGTTTAQFGFTPVSCGALMAAPANYSMSPNPTTGRITINLKEKTGSVSKSSTDLYIKTVNVYDFQQSLRLTKKFDGVKSAQLDLSSLNSGTYIVEITNGAGKKESQQIIKK